MINNSFKREKNICVVGLGVISIFEAVYQKLLGNEVTLISSNRVFGGSWGPVFLQSGKIKTDLGVHYIEEQPTTELMMNRLLGKTIRLKDKFIIKFINNNIIYEPSNKNNLYLDGGSISLEKRLKNLISLFDIKIINAKVSKLEKITEELFRVSLSNSKKEKKIFYCNKFIFTSGSKEIKFYKNGKLIDIPLRKEGKRIRSHMYFYIKGNYKKIFDQYICKEDKIIKYIHNITRDSFGNNRDYKLIVVSLLNNLEPTIENIHKTRKSLSNLGFGELNDIEYIHSIKTLLAEYDSSLNSILHSKMLGDIEYLYTEDLGLSLGKYCEKYYKKFKENNILCTQN